MANKGSRLATNQSLSTGDFLVSPNGKYTAIMQDDGNFVVYQGTAGPAIWATGVTTGVGSGPYSAVMQNDGNFVIYQGAGGPAIWATGVTTGVGSGPYSAVMQNDGNFVVSQGLGGPVIWATGVTPGVGKGPYSAVMQDDSNFVIYQGTGGSAIWASGTAPHFEDIGPDLGSLSAGVVASLGQSGFPSPAGRMLLLAGTAANVYAASVESGLWRSQNGGTWVQLAGTPHKILALDADPANPHHVAVGTSLGLYESTDSGATWTRTFDPTAQIPPFPSPAISAVAFGPNGLLLFGGTGFIASHPATFPLAKVAATPITALAFSTQGLWARTADSLFVSRDQGVTWSAAIPLPQQLRSNELTTLATINQFAYIVAGAPGGQDPRSNCGTDNIMWIYDGATWKPQRVEFNNMATCDGTGAGAVDGRRFVRVFTLAGPLSKTIGQALQLFYGCGQEVYQAKGLNPDGTVTNWSRPAGTTGPGFSNQDPLHSEIWDFLVDTTVGGGTAWIATDGGVFSNALPAPYNFPGAGWRPTVQGQHTHQAHTLTHLPIDAVSRPRLAYATQDNDAWFRDTTPNVMPAALWNNNSGLGDANWTAGDAGSPQIALLGLRLAGFMQLTAFGAGIPAGAAFQEGQRITINNDETYSSAGALGLQFIQTLKGEQPFPLLDAVMLVNLPLQAKIGGILQPVPGPLGQPNPGGGPALIRTTTFAAHPDANQSQFQGWVLEDAHVPIGAGGFWVAGGHQKPVYYLYTNEVKLYRRSTPQSGWISLNVANLLVGGPWGIGGPAFPNPYTPDELYVVTSQGIRFSTDGGVTFPLDQELTTLVKHNAGLPMTNLVHIAFDRDDPRRRVAAAYDAGVFYRDSVGTWHDLTSYLPEPLSPVVAVGIDFEAVYVMTNGRGLMRIVGYRNV